MEGSHKLLTALAEEWEEITPAQRQNLLPALETAYPLFKDWMSCFVISELLGERYSNREVLRRLEKVANERARSLVPHGFEHIVSDSGDERLAKAALEALVGMQADPSPSVRDEVRTSLHTVGRADLIDQ